MEFLPILRVLLIVAGIVALGAATWLLLDLRKKLGDALENLRGTLANVNKLSQQVAASGLLDQTKSTMSSVGSGIERVVPLLAKLDDTLADVRDMLADVAKTSQSARARIDDFAALQRELHDTSVALADLMTELRDQKLGVKVGNVLADASTLMADVGMLTESASSVLETGKPLVRGASEVINSAKKGVRSIAGGAQAVKEGIKAGVDTFKGQDGA